MSISTKRLQFLDKENKILVKDFTKDVIGNAIYTNFVAPILTQLGITSMIEGARALNALVDNYSALYQKLSSPEEAARMVSVTLTGLDLTDPRLADVSGVLNYLKNDTTGAKDQFITEVLSRTTDSFINNPSLIYKYKGVSSNVQTQMILSALATSGPAVMKSDFNKAVVTSTSSVANPPIETVKPNTSEAVKLKNTVDQYNQVVAPKVKKSDYQNPLLKPLEDSSSITDATDQEFAKICKFMNIYALFKLASYRAYAFNLYNGKRLFEDILNTNIPVSEISTPLAQFCVNVNTDVTYGSRKLIDILGKGSELLFEEMKKPSSTEQLIDLWCDRFYDVVESIIELGLKDLPHYIALDKYYTKTLFADESSSSRELSLDMIDRVQNGSAIDALRFSGTFETMVSTIVASKPSELVALSDSASNFLGVHSSTYLFFKLARKVSTIKSGATFTYLEKARQLMIVSNVASRCTDYAAKPLTSQPTKDFLDKLPYFLRSFIHSSVVKKTPTADQIDRYAGFDFTGMWKLLVAKSTRLKSSTEYDSIIYASSEELLAQYDDSTLNDTIEKAYGIFEQEAEYPSVDDLNLVKRLSAYINADDGVRPAQWVGTDVESFSIG